jgi:hypothetical protein
MPETANFPPRIPTGNELTCRNMSGPPERDRSRWPQGAQRTWSCLDQLQCGGALQNHGTVDRSQYAPSVLGGRLAPIGWSMGFLEAPIEPASERLRAWRNGLGVSYKMRRSEASWPDCLLALEPLETPWTSEILVSHGATWTAYLNNDIGGGDPFPITSHLARLLDVRWVIATHQPMTSHGHASTQLWLGGPHGEPPLNYVRTIAAPLSVRVS